MEVVDTVLTQGAGLDFWFLGQGGLNADWLRQGRLHTDWWRSDHLVVLWLGWRLRVGLGRLLMNKKQTIIYK